MASTKNIFESAVDSQKKLFDNWVETTQSFNDFTKSKAYEAAPDFYKNWLNNQMEFAKSFMKNTAPNGKSANTAASNEHFMEFYKELVSNQMNFFKNAYENMQTGAKATDFMKSMGMNNDFMKNMGVNTDFMKNMGMGMDYMNMFNNNNKQFENMNNMYNSFAGNFNKNVDMLSEMFSNTLTKDTFKNLNNNMEAYTRMYEMWLPLFKSMQTKMYDADSLKQMANPARYKEVMDKVFNFNTFEQVNEFVKMLNSTLGQTQEQGSVAMNDMFELSQKNMALLPRIMNGDTKAVSEFNANIAAYSAKFNNPIMKMFPQLKDMDFTAKTTEMVNNMNKYAEKANQMQYQMYVTGQKSLEKLIKETAELAKSGKDVSNFNEFYQKWIELTEKSYTDFFKTDEYSKLQGEVINMGLKLKQQVEAQAEQLLEGIPVAKKSELDELYKTIAELKRRVRALEKPVVVAKTPAAKPAAKAKTTKKAVKR